MLSDGESIFYVSSQTTSINGTKKTNLSSLIDENLSEDNNNLFGYIKELAIKYDLSLPNKEKDSGVLNMNCPILEKTKSDINKENIDRNILNEVFKIISKYTH